MVWGQFSVLVIEWRFFWVSVLIGSSRRVIQVQTWWYFGVDDSLVLGGGYLVVNSWSVACVVGRLSWWVFCHLVEAGEMVDGVYDNCGGQPFRVCCVFGVCVGIFCVVSWLLDVPSQGVGPGRCVDKYL